MVGLDGFVFAHHLRNGFDRRKRVLHFVGYRCRHLAERRQAFTFSQFSFQLHILVCQTKVFQSDCDLPGEYFQNRAHIRRQSIRRRANEQGADVLALPRKRVPEVETVRLWFAVANDDFHAPQR